MPKSECCNPTDEDAWATLLANVTSLVTASVALLQRTALASRGKITHEETKSFSESVGKLNELSDSINYNLRKKIMVDGRNKQIFQETLDNPQCCCSSDDINKSTSPQRSTSLPTKNYRSTGVQFEYSQLKIDSGMETSRNHQHYGHKYVTTGCQTIAVTSFILPPKVEISQQEFSIRNSEFEIYYEDTHEHVNPKDKSRKKIPSKTKLQKRNADEDVTFDYGELDTVRSFTTESVDINNLDFEMSLLIKDELKMPHEKLQVEHERHPPEEKKHRAPSPSTKENVKIEAPVECKLLPKGEKCKNCPNAPYIVEVEVTTKSRAEKCVGGCPGDNFPQVQIVDASYSTNVKENRSQKFPAKLYVNTSTTGRTEDKPRSKDTSCLKDKPNSKDKISEQDKAKHPWFKDNSGQRN